MNNSGSYKQAVLEGPRLRARRELPHEQERNVEGVRLGYRVGGSMGVQQ